MKKYETTFVFNSEPTATEKAQKAVEQVISKNKGVILEKKELGILNLGYPINKFERGYYLQIVANLDPKTIVEFEKLTRHNEEILKFMSVTVKDFVVRKRKKSRKALAAEQGAGEGKEKMGGYQPGGKPGGYGGKYYDKGQKPYPSRGYKPQPRPGGKNPPYPKKPSSNKPENQIKSEITKENSESTKVKSESTKVKSESIKNDENQEKTKPE